MNKSLVLAILCCIGISLFAQKTIMVLNNEKPIGKNSITNKDIICKEFIFPERIDNSYIDTVSNCITIELRGLFMADHLIKNIGQVVLYDLSNKKIKWTKGLNFQNEIINQRNNFIFQTGLEKTHCLDFETGEKLWKVRNFMAFIHPYLKIGVGYTPFTSYLISNNDFEGVDLKTGNIIWKREINHDYGLNDITMLNDSIAIIISSGLHSVNLNNGKGWDYNAITGASYMNAKITDIRSNLLIKNSNLYFASKGKISCLDFNGNILWSGTIPENLSSTSSISIIDSTLYMLNTGSATLITTEKKQGKPFLAAFDIKTGKKLFLSLIGDKSGRVIDCNIRNNEIILLLKNKIAKCSISNGSLIDLKTIDKRKYGEAVGFLSKFKIIKSDSTYKSLALSDTVNNYIVTKNDRILIIDDKLNVINEFDKDQLYTYYLLYNKLKFIAKNNNTIVIDNNNKIVANIEIPRTAKKIGSKLYYVKDRSVIEIDLKQLTQIE